MRHSAATITAVLLLLSLSTAAAEAKKPPSPQAQAKKAFKQLVRDTKKLPRKAVSKRNEARLLAAAKEASKLSKRKPCKAVKALRKYRKGLRRVKERKAKSKVPEDSSRRGKLEADALRVNVALMQLPKARRCGGGRKAKVTEARAKVLKSDERQLRLRLSLPAPTFAPHQVGKTAYQQMFMEGMGETGDVGKPGLPTSTEFFGVPKGANVSLTVNGTQGYELQGVNLYPHQQSAVDLELPLGAPPVDTFADHPFSIDSKTYKSKAKFPRGPAGAGEVGNIRGLNMGGVDFAGGQYKPAKDTLHVFTSIDVTLDFGGDNQGNFGDPDDFTGPWEAYFSRNYGSLTKNYQAILDHLAPFRPRRFCGTDMLIITSPALRPAADTFSAGKLAQGYSPSVREVGAGPGQIGTTKEQIQTFIRGELTSTCKVRPSYVVLLGNTAAVPTWLVPCSPGGNLADCDIASDLPYSLDGLSSDLFADVMLGRIPVTDPADANAVVNKILTYENTPPAPPGDDFYGHATVTSYFQPAMICVLNAGASGTPNCNTEAPPVNAHWEVDHANHQDTRGFTKTSEAVRNAMAANSYNVDRLYTTDDAAVIPETYYDGTPIPNHLRRPAFAWDADTTDFLDAYNAGRFLILHRDHGWPDGWAEPTIHSGHVPGLTNGSKLPVVFGINCASGAFDTPAHPSFVELQVRRIGGGAVAGFGDTRNSPSFPNNHMTRGFFDALFPNLQPAYGSIMPTRRLGDVLVRGKQFMATQEGMDWQGAGDTYVEHYLYHLLGDPSLQMWANEPQAFVPPKINTRYLEKAPVGPGDPFFQIGVAFPIGGGEPPAFGTVATLYHGDEAIGRGIVGADGKVTITPEVRTDARNLTVSFQQDGVLPAKDSVDGVPPEQTSLTLAAPPNGVRYPETQQNIFTGHLEPPFPGAKIRIVFTQDRTNQTFTKTASTAANGDYQADVRFTINQSGPWSAQAFYDGDPGHVQSASSVIQFTVTD